MTGGEIRYTGLSIQMGDVRKATRLLSRLESLPLISALVRHCTESSTCLQNQNMNQNARENLALVAIPLLISVDNVLLNSNLICEY